MTMTDLQTCDRCEGVPFTSAASYCPWCGSFQGKFFMFEEPMGPMKVPDETGVEPARQRDTSVLLRLGDLPEIEPTEEERERLEQLAEGIAESLGTGKAERGEEAARRAEE